MTHDNFAQNSGLLRDLRKIKKKKHHRRRYTYPPKEVFLAAHEHCPDDFPKRAAVTIACRLWWDMVEPRKKEGGKDGKKGG